MSCYASIANFGGSQKSDPISIVASTGLGAGFQNVMGATYLNPNGEHAQKFAAKYCATVGWNGTCEILSQDTNNTYPNTMTHCSGPGGSCQGSGIGNVLTKGQMLIRNTASEKYLKAMSSNCTVKYQPFDPTNPDSPMMSQWVPKNGCRGSCIPVYGVDPSKIDSDPVMNKILAQPWIAFDILINIYNHEKRSGDLSKLQNTKLGQFFGTQYFQKVLKTGYYKYV